MSAAGNALNRTSRITRRRAGAMALVMLLGLGAAARLGAAPQPVPAAPALPARAYFLQDHNSGAVLAEKNADERLEPASLTKIMTAYVAFSELAEGHIRLDDQVLVSEKAWKMGGSRMFIEVGTRVAVADLLRGMIVQSGNDASVALAEHIAGTEQSFAALMNQHAQRLGLTGTHFVNAEGLPAPEHYTTARDMATLTRALIREFPDMYAWHAQREFAYNDITQHNRNRLLWWDPSVDGVKTGYTKSAGYCLVVSAKRDEMRLTSVVMGSHSSRTRVQESKALLTYGFRFFETHRMFAAGQPIVSARVWEGELQTLGLGLRTDLYVTVPRGQFERLETDAKVNERVIAPVEPGAKQGVLRVQLGQAPVAERDLVALQRVDEGGLWRRLTDRVRLMLE